jgi:hypothetical protein
VEVTPRSKNEANSSLRIVSATLNFGTFKIQNYLELTGGLEVHGDKGTEPKILEGKLRKISEN